MHVLFVVIPLLGLLAAAIWFAAVEWVAVKVTAIPAWGYSAMGFGIVFSLVIGIGLMALVFYSSRHGYDEAGSGEHDELR